jgi:UDP-glucose 4-epimerase
MLVLVTGGLGFIGSHCVVELLNNNYQVVVIDNLSNSKYSVLQRIEQITNKHIIFYLCDLCNVKDVENIFSQHKFGMVIHLAALKSVNQSIEMPQYYYSHNLTITINLLTIMQKYHIKKILFSSSATVYGSAKCPFDETMETGRNLVNPYAKIKYITEEILKDIYKSDNAWSIVILRYFNPCGAHNSNLLGEDPNDIPNNLMPYILKVADGVYPILKIYGMDYDTNDGTCVRDYIHVVDLAKGHIAAMKCFSTNGIYIYNLGTGTGLSVKQIVNAFEITNNVPVPYIYADRRPGDLPSSFASVVKAKNELNWATQYNLDDICRDSWNAYLFLKKLNN